MVAACGACGLFKGCEHPKMKPHGDGGKQVLIVGDFPGLVENELGRPFVDESGSFLKQTLRSFGITLERDALATNALICSTRGLKAPEPNQIDYCHPNLVKTIQEFQPRVIITLGRSALTSVLTGVWDDIKTLERWVGWRIPIKDYWVCPTYHPSYLLRMKNQLMDRQFSDHLEAAFAIDDEPPQLPDFTKKIEVLYDEEQIAESIFEMDNDGDWIAVDYESNCLKPEYPKAEIVSCAISNGKRTISFPWVGGVIGKVGQFLASGNTRKIAQNLRFEERWTLKTFGYGVNGWEWDCMLATHCLDNRPGICSLKFQALVQMGVPAYNTEIAPLLESYKGPYNRIREIEMGSLLFYGGMDSLLEWKLAMKQRKEMGYEC
jgi:DNA polymerase